MLRRTLVAVGCAAAALVGGMAAPGNARAAVGPCPDAVTAKNAFDPSRVWSITNTRGAGVTIGVVGAPDRIDEAVCAVRMLAPDATVLPGSSSAAIVVVADASVDPASIGGPALVVAGAGDTGGPMGARPPGIVNVAAVDDSNARLATSSYGPGVMMAAYGTDTGTAAGYVAGLAAILRAAHGKDPDNWSAQQVVAQEAGSIHPASGTPHDDYLGFGILNPVQAVSPSLGTIRPDSLPGFVAMFPLNQPPRTASPSPRSQSQSPSQPQSSGAGSAPPASGASASGATTAPSGQASDSPGAGTTDSANLWPTTPLPTTGPSIVGHSATSDGGSGGVSPVLFIGLLVLIGCGGYVYWQRRRQPQAEPVKQQQEWEAPSGPRHSGYSPPED